MLMAHERSPFRRGFLRAPPIWGMIAIAAALVCLGGFAAHGFGENGLRLGSELTWRFTCLGVFRRRDRRSRDAARPRQAASTPWPGTAPIVVGILRQLRRVSRQPCWCPTHSRRLRRSIEGLTAGMSVFAIFGAGLTMVIAYAPSPQPSLGERSRRAILGVGMAYFWLAYTLNGPVAYFRPASPGRILRLQSGLDDDRAASAFRRRFCGETARPWRPAPDLTIVRKSTVCGFSRTLVTPGNLCFTFGDVAGDFRS